MSSNGCFSPESEFFLLWKSIFPTGGNAVVEFHSYGVIFASGMNQRIIFEDDI